MRMHAAFFAGLGLSFTHVATGQELKVAPEVPAVVGLADSVVADEIVVHLSAPAARILEIVGRPGAGLTGVPSLDALKAQLGVQQWRKQFIGADPLLALRRGVPDLSGYYVVRFDPTLATVDEVVAAYRADPFVIDAEPIGIHPVFIVPNDGNYPSQWHLNQANDKDIDAPEAWNIETGDPTIIVAVLDTGVRYYHKDLGGSNASAANPMGTDGNMWINGPERTGTAGVDDDGNGFVDDWVGYDFVTGITGCSSGEDCSGTDNDPRDFAGHGTHCAGNVSAINNNGYATASPAGGWNAGANTPDANGVEVMALRIGYATPFGGFVRMDFAASAFFYAANNGAKIASCSWGSSNSGGVAAALDYFVASGSRLVFVAAGNANNQTQGYLNSRADCYSVAATDQNDVKASFSSYGSWVEISAPGVSILSAYHSSSDPNNDYVASLSGTSMACPLTAGTAAAVWSRNPTWTAAQVWDQVRTTVDNINAQNPSFVGLLGSGRINLFNAVNTAPPPPQCQNNAECDDGNPCNGVETCVGGFCQNGPVSPDCNGNGNLDSCDIASGTAQDCNGNGIPDSCDISSGSSQDCTGNGIPDECEVDPCPPGSDLLLAFTAATTLPNIGTVQNEDIAKYNTGTGQWSLYFDGSDVGLTSFAIDALAVLPSGELLISVDVSGTIGGISTDDSDILRFTPTSLGANTAGTWAMYFDGSDVGLTQSTEDIDGLSIAPDGRLVISTTGSPSVTGLTGLADEDLIIFTATSLGSTTAGTWSLYFDGSDVGLADSSSEDVDAVSILNSGLISLSTLGSFSVTGLSGANEDVFDFSPTSLGSTTAGSYSAFFVGVSAGVPSGADVGAAEELE
ncbi:MAG: S8 family serine peptidase [Phycisphaerales bacterium]|nr:S8 family serine peptidase [Phycisphaerales bacterium]